MLNAWIECAARIECQLYNQNLPATSPRVSPLGERRLVYQIFQYLERTRLIMHLRCANQHIMTCHLSDLYIFTLIDPFEISKYRLNGYQPELIKSKFLLVPVVQIKYMEFTGAGEWPTIKFISKETIGKESAFIIASGTYYHGPMICYNSFKFKIDCQVFWWRVTCDCVFVYDGQNINIWILDDLVHGTVNPPCLAFLSEFPRTFTALNYDFLHIAVNQIIITLDMQKKIIIRRINPKLGMISSFCFRNNQVLCIANNQLYAVLIN
jgi:hypothetical protein